MNKNSIDIRCHRIFFLFSLITLFLFFLPQFVKAQSNEKFFTSQNSNDPQLLEKAEQNQYTIRNIYFAGDFKIRDRVLRRKIGKFINDWDTFSRQNLYKGLMSLNTLKNIRKVEPKDIEASLDEKQKYIYIAIPIREK